MFTAPTIEALKAHLAITGDSDDALLEAKLAAAHDHIAGLLGDGLAPAGVAREATLQLAAYWHENREGVGFDRDTLPASIGELIDPYRLRAW